MYGHVEICNLLKNTYSCLHCCRISKASWLEGAKGLHVLMLVLL